MLRIYIVFFLYMSSLLAMELDFHGTRRVIDLIKRTMNCAGIWPEKIHEPIFVFFAVYLVLQCTMGVISINNNISDMEYVIACLEENVFNFMTLFKICICRMNSNSLAKILKEIKLDLIPERYKTDEEKIAFLNYNTFSLKLVKFTLGTSITACLLYYVSFSATNIKKVISMVLHVSGVISALSTKVKYVLDNPENRKRRIKVLILRHTRLIRLADTLENDFNLLILQQLLGSTFHLCLLGYDALVSISAGEQHKLLAFVIIAFRVLTTLLAYCYIGECLINESTSFGESFYHCKWYNITQEEIKLMHICMMRSSKQMELTVGKFFILSLTTFTDVVKTSMAYLSVLRTFM
ncbi:odorant receptor 63a-like isoform X2 [Vespa velutina]|uniref:odorant receptor 63a-like isoform X2 n=1 Tax=Vespa velutina TaxID=202808 RepID=UPI001FB39728|nr:odorant receptor 63a-like isoform X2 [Vespa velutina]